MKKTKWYVFVMIFLGGILLGWTFWGWDEGFLSKSVAAWCHQWIAPVITWVWSWILKMWNWIVFPLPFGHEVILNEKIHYSLSWSSAVLLFCTVLYCFVIMDEIQEKKWVAWILTPAASFMSWFLCLWMSHLIAKVTVYFYIAGAILSVGFAAIVFAIEGWLLFQIVHCQE